MTALKPTDLKKLAQRFTEKYYPQWISRVDRIWDMLEKTDLSRIFSDPEKSNHQYGNALGISGPTDPQFKGYINVIATLLITYQGVKDENYLTNIELKKQLSKVPASLKITADIQQKLENVFHEISSLMIGEVVQSENEIIFTESEILGLDNTPVGKTYPFILLENVILKKRVHWLWGFVFFGEWTCGNLLDNSPRDQFFNYKSKISKEVEKFGLKIASERGGDELWIDNYETAKTVIKCNLFEAVDDYTLAAGAFERGDISKSIEELKTAISPTHYPEIKYIDAYNLLIQCVFALDYEGLPESLLIKIKGFLRWYKIKLETAIFIIKEVYLKMDIISKKRIIYELENLENELRITNDNYKSILSKTQITTKEKEFTELVDLIQDLNKIIYQHMVVERHIVDFIYSMQEFNDLKDYKHIRSIFDIHYTDIKQMHRQEDIIEIEKFLLFSMLKEGIDFDKYCDLSSLKEYLNLKLKAAINKMKSKV